MTKNIEWLSLVFTLVVSAILGIGSISIMGEYGWMVFVLIPLIIGFLPPFIISKTKPISKSKSYEISFITLGIACLGLLVFAMEGLICIAMAAPISAGLTWLGAYLGYATQGKKIMKTTNTSLLLLFSALGLMSFDKINEPQGLIPVTTQIIVDAEIAEVWKNVVTFSKIESPRDWIFKTGIAFPTDATIDGTGVGAIRYCNFSTGSFVEPITKWEEPHLLQFEVREQPVPMTELNPFWKVHPPHLEGYFKSVKGEFSLSKIEGGKTQLAGTTWYQVDLSPEIYWRMWSGFIIHKIHQRVLNHIKGESEQQ